MSVFYGYALGVVFFTVQGIPQRFETLLVCISLSSCALAIAGPLMAEIFKCVPRNMYAKSYGLLNVAIAIGMFIGPLFGGLLYEKLGGSVCAYQ